MNDVKEKIFPGKYLEAVPGDPVLTIEERYIVDVVLAARQIQEFLWADMNDESGLEEFRRMFRKPIKDIRYAFSKAVKAIGLQYGQKAENGYVFHDLRHTFVTYMRKAGVPESVIMELTGHQTRSMFDRYNRVDVDDKFEASGRYINYLKSIPNAAKNTTNGEK